MKWARARQAAWSDEELPRPVTINTPAVVVAPASVPVAPPPIEAAPPPIVVARQAPKPVRAEPPEAPAAERTRPRVQIPVGALAKYLAIAAVGAIVTTAGLLYGPGLWSTASKLTTSGPAQTPGRKGGAASPARSGAPLKTTGDVRVSSTPAGATVRVDGKPRGVTPIPVTDLAVGSHSVEIQSASGAVRRNVSIAAGQTGEISEEIFSGWLKVFAPFELTITEGTRALRLDERSQVMLPSGPHDLVFANRDLGFEEKRHVELKPGETSTISLTPPRSTLTVTASAAAQVLIDGMPAGGTPLAAVPIDLGTHQIVVRSASGAERRFTVTITVKPLTLNVDFSTPAK